MTPFLLFRYIFAVICAVGFSVLLVMYVLAQMVDWEKYEANRKKHKCGCKLEKTP